MKLAHLSAAILTAIAVAIQPLSPVFAAESTSGTEIVGQILDTNGGLPVANATVDLYRGTERVAQTTTGPDGSFHFEHELPGVYSLQISAPGYNPTQATGIFVTADERQVSYNTAITKSAASTQNLKVIGRETATSRGALQTSATINYDVPSDLVLNENYVRVGDALGTLPGVTTATSSAVGDDLTLNIRGFNSTETATLLDGHPIGPIGAHSAGFDYQDSPFFAIRNTQVIFGSGATGLYGADTIAGAVNFETLDPTLQPHELIKEGIGNDGKALTAFDATGTTANGKLGYVFAHAVQGTYGNFAPAQITQTGLLGTDFTTANIAANTYSVTGAYLLHNDLAKLRYDFDNKTQLTFTAYSSTSWDDKSGNGDTDYNSYDVQLYNAQQTVAGYGPNNPAPAGCPNGIVVKTDANPNLCVTPQQYAALSSGPAGGGPGPWQAIRNQDYHARLTRQLGANNLFTVDSFVDNYALDYNRNEAGGLFPVQGTNTQVYTGGFRTSFYKTTGLLLSDDIASAKNTFGFGYYVEHQRINGDQSYYNFDSTGSVVTSYGINQLPEYGQGSASYFLRDQFTPNARLSIFGNVWLKHSNITGKSELDPRVSMILHPTNDDVVRFTGGHSDSEPAPQLRFGPPSLNLTPTNLNPTCNGNQETSVGSISDPNLVPETATDFELGYGHRFHRGDTIQLNLYTANEQNALFGGTLPVSALGNVIPSFLLQQYYNRISQLCSNIPNPTLGNLAVSTTYNAAQARYRGVELAGRYHFTQRLYADYLYDVQSAAYLGVPDSILKNNVELINGSQVVGVPLHKASVGLDYSWPTGWEVRLDEYYLDGNNGFNRPAFTYGNMFISKNFRNTIVTLGINNVFDDAVDTYGRIGLGVFYPENQDGSDTSAVQQGTERFGLPPRQFQLIVTQRI